MALAPTDIHHPDPQEAAAHAGMPPVSEIGVELESSNGKQFPDLFRYGPINFAAIPAGRVPGADIVLRLLDYAMSEEDDAEVAAPRQTSAPAPAAPLTQARVSPPEPGPLRLSHNLQAIVPHSPVRLPKGEPKVEARVSEAPQPTRIEKPAEPPRPASPAAEPPKPAAARVTPPPPAESQPARVTRRPDAAVRPPDVRIQRPPEPAPRPPVSVRSPEPASRPATVPAAAPAAAPPTGKPAESQAAKTGVAEPPASAAKAGTHPESPEVRPAAQSPAQSKTQQAPAVPAQAVSTARPLFNASATVPAPAAEPVASAIVPVPAAEPARLDETLPNLDISPGRSPVIKIALVLGVLLVGSVAVWQIAGSKNAPPGNSDTYEATPMTLGGGGWATDAATDEAGKHLRQLSFYRPSLQLADYRVEFAGVIEKRALGWIFRMSDLKNYYGMKVSVTGGKSVLVRYAMVDGRETGRTEIPLAAPVRLGSTVKVKVDIKGARFSTTVQDQPADVWTDSQLKAGAFGFANDRDERAKIETIQFGLLRSGAR